MKFRDYRQDGTTRDEKIAFIKNVYGASCTIRFEEKDDVYVSTFYQCVFENAVKYPSPKNAAMLEAANRRLDALGVTDTVTPPSRSDRTDADDARDRMIARSKNAWRDGNMDAARRPAK